MCVPRNCHKTAEREKIKYISHCNIPSPWHIRYLGSYKKLSYIYLVDILGASHSIEIMWVVVWEDSKV